MKFGDLLNYLWDQIPSFDIKKQQPLTPGGTVKNL